MLALATALAVLLAGFPAAPVLAAPSKAQVSSDRARLTRAIAKLEAARKRSAAVSAKVRRYSDDLDRLMTEQRTIRERLHTRAVTMYRSGDDAYLSILFSADTFEDFAARWDLLMRMSEQDAKDLLALDAAHASATRSATSLLELQAAEARAADAMAREVSAARLALASSSAALQAYEARLAAARKAAARNNAPDQGLTGSGAWLTGNASHYSINFSGKGASGARITPYSMMVAHRTLPFHTLVEIEYNGKRCVASVEDRGPFVKNRVFDLGPGVVRVLGFNGVHPVRYRIIGK